MYASDYRRIARDRLTGNWAVSVGAGFVAALLGGAMSGGNSQVTNRITQQLTESGQLPPELVWTLLGVTMTLSLWGLVLFIIGGVIRQGYCQFLLNQQDGKELRVKDLFSQFHRFGDGFVLALLESIFIFLWTLLLIIPGIIAAYRYAMAPYILLEDPNMRASQALKASSELMNGHKWELFCLELSFIGWDILCLFTLGIGSLWLNPYKSAAHAAFYRNIAGENR